MYLAASGPVITGLGILYVVLLITLGVVSLRKGHRVMFIIGLFVTLLVHRSSPPLDPSALGAKASKSWARQRSPAVLPSASALR